MKKSLIIELQKEALDDNLKISTLLRKSLVVAKKLNISDFEIWISSELNGYTCDLNDIPEYRLLHGKLEALNQYHGWRPAIISDEKTAELVSTIKISQSIASIESLVNSDSGYLSYSPHQNQQNILSEVFSYSTKFQLNISKSQVVSILDAVRNIVLEWALRLENDGILGNELSFSDDEKHTAVQEGYVAKYFFKNMKNSQIQINSPYSTQTFEHHGINTESIKAIIDSLSKNYKQMDLSSDNIKIIKSEVKSLKKIISSKNIDENKAKQSLFSIQTVLQGAVGSLIGSGILYMITTLLS